MKMMIGYDGSKAAKNALALAKEHASAFNPEKIYILYCLEGDSQEQVRQLDIAQQHLDFARVFLDMPESVCEAGLSVRNLSPGEALVEFANQKGINEIFIGVKRKSKVGKLIFGSVAQYVILNAGCPVMTTR